MAGIVATARTEKRRHHDDRHPRQGRFCFHNPLSVLPLRSNTRLFAQFFNPGRTAGRDCLLPGKPVQCRLFLPAAC